MYIPDWVRQAALPQNAQPYAAPSNSVWTNRGLWQSAGSSDPNAPGNQLNSNLIGMDLLGMRRAPTPQWGGAGQYMNGNVGIPGTGTPMPAGFTPTPAPSAPAAGADTQAGLLGGSGWSPGQPIPEYGTPDFAKFQQFINAQNARQKGQP